MFGPQQASVSDINYSCIVICGGLDTRMWTNEDDCDFYKVLIECEKVSDNLQLTINIYRE